ncbi:MAG: hypothetical protein WCD49_06880 [Candidatus Acidiferrales bacterium]
MNRVLRFFAAMIFAASCLAFMAVSTRAQSDSAVPSQNPGTAGSSDGGSQAPDKKVWTNDDFSSHPRRAASTSPNSNSKPANTTNKPKPDNGGKNAAWYGGQISKLQDRIPPLDEKISQLQAALSGQQVNAPRPYGWSKPDDWRTQLAQYQKQREDIRTKISALEDAARHNGVPENEIP